MSLKKGDGEFSRIYDVSGLGRDLVRVDINPTSGELLLLRDRLKVLEVKSLSANSELQRQKKSTVIEVRIDYKTTVAQQCVATLKPVDQVIEEQFSICFSEEDACDPIPEGVEVVHTLEDEDPPEAIVDGKIDVVDILAEYIALALDPYPRAEEAPENVDVLDNEDVQDAPETKSEEDRIYPFANLKEMMEKK